MTMRDPGHRRRSAPGRRLVLVGGPPSRGPTPTCDIDRGERTLVDLPLRVAGRTIGAINLSFPGAFEPDPTELDFLDIMADTCAQAFERIEASVVARRQTARLEFLAEASIELASSLDLDVTINRVARLAVPTFADWCAIDVVRDGRVHRLAVAHVDPRKVELAVALQERWPPDPASPSGARAVARTGKPELIHEITDEMLVAGCRDPEQLRIARELQLRSALLVPLWVRGRVIGVLSWVSTDEQRLYEEDDVRFAEHLARRAATAIDNSELYSQTRAAAEQLQHAVLPQALVGDDRWEVSCHYRPSGRAEVGGDFYDAFVLGDGRYVAFIGDVMGRGVAAAAAMAEMRAATRAFASVDPDPAAVLRQAGRAWSWRYGSDQLVTLVYVLADATAGHLRRGQRRPPAALGAACRRVGRAAAVHRRAAARGGHRASADGSRCRSASGTPCWPSPTGSSSDATRTSTPGWIDSARAVPAPGGGLARERRERHRRGRARRHLRRRHGCPGAAAAGLARRRPTAPACGPRPVVVGEGGSTSAGGGDEGDDHPASGVADRDPLLEQHGDRVRAVARGDPAEDARRHPAQRRGAQHRVAEGAAGVLQDDPFAAGLDHAEPAVDGVLQAHEAVPELFGRHPPDDLLGEAVLLLHLPADVGAHLGDGRLGGIRAVVGLEGLRELHDHGPQERLLAEPALGAGLVQRRQHARGQPGRVEGGGGAARHRQGDRHDHPGVGPHRRAHLGRQRLDDQQAPARVGRRALSSRCPRSRVDAGVLRGRRATRADRAGCRSVPASKPGPMS